MKNYLSNSVEENGLDIEPETENNIAGWWYTYPWKIVVNWAYFPQYMEK